MDAVTPQALGRRIRGEGETSEAEWREWLGRLSLPPLPASILTNHNARLVVVSPHPDDEVLACGGLIATHTSRGGGIAVIAVTDGEASHRGDPRWPTDRLAAARRAERVRGLSHLGVGQSDVTCLGFADGAVGAEWEALCARLRGLLSEGDVVVSTWALDGHPDHDATGLAVDTVCAERGCRVWRAPVWMWHWSTRGDPRVPWRQLRSFALTPRAADQKAKALAEHATQLSPRVGESGPVLGESILARATRHSEYFFV